MALSSERGRARGARLAARLSYEEAALLCARPAGPRLLAPRQPGGQVRTATRPGHGHARPPVPALTRWAGQTQKPPGPFVCSSDSVEGSPGAALISKQERMGTAGSVSPRSASRPGSREAGRRMPAGCRRSGRGRGLAWRGSPLTALGKAASQCQQCLACLPRLSSPGVLGLRGWVGSSLRLHLSERVTGPALRSSQLPRLQRPQCA